MKYIIYFTLIILIVIRYFATRPHYKDGDTLRITTTVYSDPTTYGNYQTFTALGLKISLPIYPEISYGDKVVIEGVVSSPKLGKAKLINKESFRGFASGFRDSLVNFYVNTIPQPMAGLIAGITIGSKSALTPDFWDKVKSTGVAHVVVASGTNVTFVVSFVFSVTALFLSRRKAIFIVILSIVLYLFISGFQAPIVRAAIMAFMTFSAQGSGRLLTSARNLLLTAGIMLLIVPSWITDLGFILSFVSTASIMIFNQKIAKLLKFMPKVLKEGFSTSLAAQIGVAPIIYLTFGRFNIFSPLINAIVLWTVPYIMVLGTIGGIVGLAIPILGRLILYVCYPLAWWFEKIVSIFG